MPAQGDGPNLGGPEGRIKRMNVEVELELEAHVADTLRGAANSRWQGQHVQQGTLSTIPLPRRELSRWHPISRDGFLRARK